MKSVRCFAVVAALCLASSCAPESEPAPFTGVPSAGGLYLVSLDFSPSAPIPDQPTLVQVVLTTPTGGVVELADVSVTATSLLEESLDTVSLESARGGLFTGELTFGVGAWTVAVDIAPAGLASDTVEFGVIVNCNTDGAQSSLCCAATDCDAGLLCVHGVCESKLAEQGEGCYDDSECGTGNCEGKVCMPAPTCLDGRSNGFESGLDCGGECEGCADGAACSAPSDCLSGACAGGLCVPGVDVLGGGQHTLESVDFLTLSDSGIEHNIPTDLEFHPVRQDELWVVSKGNHSMWIANDASSTTQVAVKKQDISGAHFMVNPTSFAFGARGCTSTRADVPTTSFTSESVCMATIHEEDKTTPFTNNAPGYFMGPTLWTGDKDRFDGGHGGHYDMLHNSPNGMGIAWEEGNVYWVFDGYHSALVRYDFVQDHGPGGTYHADAVVKRYVEGEVARVPNIPSHMAYDKDTGLLYVADTGNNRIAVLDAATGKPGAATFPNMDNSTQYQVDDAILTTLVDGAEVDMVHPSGLELHDGMLFVTDNKTSKIMAFTLEGELLDHLDTGLPTGSLMGLTFDKNGSLFFVDAVRNAVHRVAPK